MTKPIKKTLILIAISLLSLCTWDCFAEITYNDCYSNCISCNHGGGGDTIPCPNPPTDDCTAYCNEHYPKPYQLPAGAIL